MSFERILGEDCCGNPTHSYVVKDKDGSKLDFTFFTDQHPDDVGTLSIFTEIETDIGVIKPTFVIGKDDVVQLAKALKGETK